MVRNKYPPNWKTEIAPTILARDRHRCRICKVKNYTVGRRVGHFVVVKGEYETYKEARAQAEVGYHIVIVLAVAHLNHDTTDNRDENLEARCQYHHLRHDREHHRENQLQTWQQKRQAREGELVRGEEDFI